jgi:hypothetical protein
MSVRVTFLRLAVLAASLAAAAFCGGWKWNGGIW